VAFSSDGSHIVAVNEEKTVFAWDASTGQIAADPPAEMPPGAGEEAKSPDGRITARIDSSRKQLIAERLPARGESWVPQGRVNRERLGRWYRFDPSWHLAQAREAEDAADHFATEFHLRLLLRHLPHDAPAHVRLAHLYARQDRRDKAALHLTQALLLNPRVPLWPVDPDAGRRGVAAAEAGDWSRAVRLLRLAAHQPGASEDVWPDLLMAHLATGDHDGARKAAAE
jgi:predicted Zn-dependent protease